MSVSRLLEKSSKTIYCNDLLLKNISTATIPSDREENHTSETLDIYEYDGNEVVLENKTNSNTITTMDKITWNNVPNIESDDQSYVYYDDTRKKFYTSENTVCFETNKIKNTIDAYPGVPVDITLSSLQEPFLVNCNIPAIGISGEYSLESNLGFIVRITLPSRETWNKLIFDTHINTLTSNLPQTSDIAKTYFGEFTSYHKDVNHILLLGFRPPHFNQASTIKQYALTIPVYCSIIGVE